MALQIRRGTAAQRTSITPSEGELLYTTDTKIVYIGDGSTAGGNVVSGGSNIIDDTTPQLGGNLDVNGFNITSAGNGNVTIDPAGTGVINLNADVNLTGGLNKTGVLEISASNGVYVGKEDGSNNGFLAITTNTWGGATGFNMSLRQHHSAADANNFLFYRTRGTALLPTAVQNNDKIVDLVFSGHDGTVPLGIAVISAQVAGVVSTGVVPGKLTFSTNNGTATAVRAELSSAGAWRVNEIQNYSGSTLTITATSINAVGNVQLNAQSNLRFADSDSSNWVAFQAPATVASNVTWTLPSTDGTSGQSLTTNGSGTLSWTSITSGANSRTTVSGTTGVLSNGATGNISITGFKGYILYKITVSGAAWVRVYTDVASQTSDAGRLEGVDPAPGAGVIAEVITTGAQTILITPGSYGFSNELPATTAIPVAVTNKSGSSGTFTVDLTVVQLEA